MLRARRDHGRQSTQTRLAERQRWQHHRTARLTEPGSGAPITLEPYLMELEQLAGEYKDDANKQAILRALFQYAENL